MIMCTFCGVSATDAAVCNQVLGSKQIVTDNLVASKKNRGAVEEYTVKGHYYIRVLVEEHPLKSTIDFELSAPGGFVLESPAHSNITALFNVAKACIQVKEGVFHLVCQDGNVRKIKHNDIEICAPGKTIELNGFSYQGSVRIVQDAVSKKLCVINILDIEDYLYSVLRYESIPYWPLEAHKVQAVTSRTYAAYHMRQNRIQKNPLPYDIKNTTKHQVYNGVHSSEHLRLAVEQTKGMVLTYRGAIALTMFDICCGGIVPGLLKSCDVTKPYLCRKTQCTYCKGSPHYAWKEVVSTDEMLKLLKKHEACNALLGRFGDVLLDMAVVSKDRAGIAYRVKCVGRRRSVLLPASSVKAALGKRIKSFAFSIKKEGKSFVIQGRGNSHFKGLCQLGAKKMVDQGKSFKEVLRFYFPGTTLCRLR